ncbi:hypothetical protein M378DRAFT_166221 [Amanita muscaria Koide BX008]|uniref:Uncharacterized protein n=1 Tax=Amanita muscaria (strain Koide BX008) TaxID=946122 RepID=A0A0C2WYZ1_AMAMK|nr:hypothetical protein M378DRAFT_166221 [Amanita muscaria Koide BX008]
MASKSSKKARKDKEALSRMEEEISQQTTMQITWTPSTWDLLPPFCRQSVLQPD